MKHFSIALTVLTTIIFCSCQKDNSTRPDASKVIFRIKDPLSGQAYSNGDTIFMQAEVQYSAAMHGYNVSLTDSASGAVFFQTGDHAHDSSFTINTYWVDTLTVAKTMRLEFQVAIDHDGNAAKQGVYIYNK